jgi:hypothetical protein
MLKGTVSRDFFFWFFLHGSVYPQPQSIPLGPFRIFSKIRGDVFASQGAPPVLTLPPVSTTPAANFAPSFPSVVDTGGKFATGVVDTGGKP